MKKIFVIVLCFAISGCNGLAAVEPTATTTLMLTNTPTLTPVASVTPESTATPISTLPHTLVPTPDYQHSVLFASFPLNPSSGGPLTSCNLVSPYFNTQKITALANIYIDSNQTIPAEDISVVMVQSGPDGSPLIDENTGSYKVLSTGVLACLSEGQTGSFTHMAIFDGVNLIDPDTGNLYVNGFFFQVRTLNSDGTIGVQVGGPSANCSIVKTFTQSGNGSGGNGGGNSCPAGQVYIEPCGCVDPRIGCQFGP